MPKIPPPEFLDLPLRVHSPVRWITPAYMALIDPFRPWIVYPQMLDQVRKQWIRHYAEPLVAPE